MYPRKKGHSKKLILAVLLIVVLIAASAAIVYATMFSAKKVEVGVHVGDSFTYSLKGSSSLGLGAYDSPGFDQYNATEYYKITITGVEGTVVSMDTLWRFQNGTEVSRPQTIDIASGNKTDPNGFWALYPANLNKNDLLRPKGFDNQVVNATETKTYADSTRMRNFWWIENEFQDMTDPTHNTFMYDYRNIYFDQKTGMLDVFSDYQEFNNPQKIEVITWTLVNCTVWNV